MLIIEDEASLGNEISDRLKSEGLATEVLRNKQDGLTAALVKDAAVIILARPARRRRHH